MPMNKYIEEYIGARAFENKDGILNKFQIGEKEFNKKPKEGDKAYPFFDSSQKLYYRYKIDELEYDDYKELLKWIPSEKKEKKISGWYYFAIALIMIGIVGALITVLAGGKEYAITAISMVVGILTLCSQIILLSKIEYNTRKE